MHQGEDKYTLADLYRAYRKSKSEAHYEKSYHHSLAYTKYEGRLEYNLSRLLAWLNSESFDWCADANWMGTFSHIPKSIDHPAVDAERETHFATLDPLVDWASQCNEKSVSLRAEYRQTINPSVDLQVLSALWLITAGEKYDDAVDHKLAYAHRLRRTGKSGPVALESYALFTPYIGGYREWRANGLNSMRKALSCGDSVVAITMDVKQFYHRVSPKFLVRKSFLNRLGISLTSRERLLTLALINCIDTWYAGTPDYKKRPEGALPVGLSASKLISNVLLAEFDTVISRTLNPIYYGRYADDVFIVLRGNESLNNGEAVVKYIRRAVGRFLVLERGAGGSGLKLRLPYAEDSELVFSKDKQKIFFLSGQHGLDLVDQIEEKIQAQSSEYRLLPELPSSPAKMASQALLASSDARLDADAIRKAEAVSLRRLGFSMLMSNVEAYERDLAPKEWLQVRNNFYGIVSRYLLSPSGYFDFPGAIVRVFGLMVACGDLSEATKFLERFEKTYKLIRDTTTAGKQAAIQAASAHSYFYRGFYHVTIEAGAVARFDASLAYRRLLARLTGAQQVPRKSRIKELAARVLKADLGRRPYYEYWVNENRAERKQPQLPTDFSVRRILVATREFRSKVRGGLKAPYWPAVAFPTRPIPVWLLAVHSPDLLSIPGALERAIWATRGGQVNPKYRGFAFRKGDSDGSTHIECPAALDQDRVIAVPSFLTQDAHFEASVSGRPIKTIERYEQSRQLVNRILRDSPNVQYIAFPECSLPLNWALSIAQKLARRGVSFIAGIENYGRKDKYVNGALVSLASTFYGRKGSVCYLQPKLRLAHRESESCAKRKRVFVEPDIKLSRPVYVHGGLHFGVLICSDLTTVDNRAHYQGEVDALFVLEWNKDVSTFQFLIESSAHDLHAAIIQVNNRQYGDSRIRVPYFNSWDRDVVRVKGGDEDFYVVSTIDFGELREFQRGTGSAMRFKPLPIGYSMSPKRFRSSSF